MRGRRNLHGGAGAAEPLYTGGLHQGRRGNRHLGHADFSGGGVHRPRFFDNIAKHAGAGTLVPITGFANAMVSPAMEFKSEGMITGTAVKLFTVAGPVLVYGISASVIYGIILSLFQMA